MDIFFIFLLICFGAFFAICEISMAASRKVKLQILLDNGDPRASLVMQLQSHSGSFFAAVQIALNAVAILGGIIGESAFTPIFKDLISIIYEGKWLNSIAFTFSFIMVTSLFILFADLIPKRIGMALPEKVAISFIRIMLLSVTVLKPLVWFFNIISDSVLRLFNMPFVRDEQVTSDDISAVMDAGMEHGAIQSHEHKIIENVLELEQRTIGNVMTFREEVCFFSTNQSDEQIKQLILKHNHHFYPLCDGELNNVVALVEATTILHQLIQNDHFEIDKIENEPNVLFLPQSLNLSDALGAFKRQPVGLALVINEFSTVVGVVSLKDILNVVVNHKKELQEFHIHQIDANSWELDGALSLLDVEKIISTTGLYSEENIDTLGGLMMHLFKRLPNQEESISFNHLHFKIKQVNNISIEKIIISTQPI
ncbi:hemolysin family protein [Marinicellulosiphila megalodicopiae]|uniref:hemolysin family protein n=1 Tax=Marinicellulosiphila megalodicopiae TaxID=2724896 RepID=UPI003BB0055C